LSEAAAWQRTRIRSGRKAGLKRQFLRPLGPVGETCGHVEIDEGAQHLAEWTKPATRSNNASPSLRATRAAKGARAAARWKARDPRSAVRQA
jgi:hypothetical protein